MTRPVIIVTLVALAVFAVVFTVILSPRRRGSELPFGYDYRLRRHLSHLHRRSGQGSRSPRHDRYMHNRRRIEP